MADPAVGLQRTEMFEVTLGNLATEWANDLPVLATPVVLWWTELVAMHIMEIDIDDAEVTVGVGHDQVRHLAPSGLGAKVLVGAEVIPGKLARPRFRVWAEDHAGPIYEGIHTRAVVPRHQIEALLAQRTP